MFSYTQVVVARACMPSSDLVTFPHDARSAIKTAKAGVITVNDIICEDTFSIMTRSTDTDTVSHTAAVYSLDSDTSSLRESTRSEHAIQSDGSARVSLCLTQAVGATASMEQVYAATARATAITATDSTIGSSSTATFSKSGLRWDDASSSLYLGGDVFRIQYSAGDDESNDSPCLRIQGKRAEDGVYVTRFSVVNE